MTLQDFVNHPRSRAADLQAWHVAVLRFYTTSSFRQINGPLRDGARPHPLAMVVFYLSEAIKKLQGAKAPEESDCEVVLWHGMEGADLYMRQFKKLGATELGAMSATEVRDLAQKRSEEAVAVVFKHIAAAPAGGASLQYLSVY